MRDELLRRLHLDGDNRVEEINKLLSLVLLGEEKVDTVLGLLDVEGIPMGAVLHDQLLEEQKGSLVEDLLADLDGGSPDVGRVRLGALGALLVGHDVDHLEALLEEHAILDGVLDGELDLDTARVWLCPDEARVDDADLVQAAQLLEAQGQQLAGLGGGHDPAGGGHEPSVAVSAEVEGGLALDALGNVDGELDAVVAEGAGGSRSIDGGAAVAAENTEVSVSRPSFSLRMCAG